MFAEYNIFLPSGDHLGLDAPYSDFVIACASPPIATTVSHGMLGAPMLAEIQDAPSMPTVAVSSVAPFIMTVIWQITAVSGKYTV